jgi:hypothetical protein
MKGEVRWSPEPHVFAARTGWRLSSSSFLPATAESLATCFIHSMRITAVNFPGAAEQALVYGK